MSRVTALLAAGFAPESVQPASESGVRAFLGTELIADITVLGVLLLLATIAVGFLVSAIVNAIVRRLGRAMDPKSWRHAMFAAFDGPLRWGILVASFWLGYLLMQQGQLAAVESDLQRVVVDSTDDSWGVFLACELPFILWFCFRVVNAITDMWQARAEATEGTYDDQLVPIVRTGSKIVITIIGVVMIIQNLGGDVGALLAGMGIGGVAVAMAAKDTIANLFGSIVIFVDRPFLVGDWVEIGGEEGTVEEVGLRVTRIRTFANSLITIPNANLTTTPINNWSRMEKRRIKMTIGLTYDTTPEQMEQAVGAIREVLESDDRICQDFMLVNFSGFGPSSLDIFVYAFTVTTNWAEFMKTRQEIMLEWMRRMQRLGLDFAFPTQTIHLEPGSTPPPPSSGLSGLMPGRK